MNVKTIVLCLKFFVHVVVLHISTWAIHSMLLVVDTLVTDAKAGRSELQATLITD
jgi:hypothetical protein